MLHIQQRVTEYQTYCRLESFIAFYFLFVLSSLMDIPAVQLLCMEQGDRSLDGPHERLYRTGRSIHHPGLLALYFLMKSASGCLRLVLEGVLPLLWRGSWRIMDCISPSALLRRTVPAQLPNQRPASHHPTRDNFLCSCASYIS